MQRFEWTDNVGDNDEDSKCGGWGKPEDGSAVEAVDGDCTAEESGWERQEQSDSTWLQTRSIIETTYGQCGGHLCWYGSGVATQSTGSSVEVNWSTSGSNESYFKNIV